MLPATAHNFNFSLFALSKREFLSLIPVISGQDGRQGGAEGLTFWPRQVARRQAADVRSRQTHLPFGSVRRHFLVSSQGPREPTLADHGGRTGGDPVMNDGFDRNGDLQTARASDADAF